MRFPVRSSGGLFTDHCLLITALSFPQARTSVPLHPLPQTPLPSYSDNENRIGSAGCLHSSSVWIHCDSIRWLLLAAQPLPLARTSFCAASQKGLQNWNGNAAPGSRASDASLMEP